MKENKTGVYFDHLDYANFFQRVSCLIIDFLFVWILQAVLFSIINTSEKSNYFTASVILYIVFVLLYFTLIKASVVRTIGYRIMKIRIVNLQGEKPKFYMMLYRFLLGALAPFNLIFDILWLVDDDNKQSMRDKFAGTYVIKQNAKPSGSNVISAENLLVMTNNLWFKAVKRD